ncbi:hypothetical protein [Propionivibrio sp.]|uniref:hypothetical protein n=1 Tax=Propionivibrio sp. TaxID=2212460 RepID=UPI0025F2B16C|nr:hypothetical protein [Propionivibrio sp.]
MRLHAGTSAIEDDRFLWQPFQASAGGQFERYRLRRFGTSRAIPFAGAGSGDLGVCLWAEICRNAQLVAAGNA